MADDNKRADYYSALGGFHSEAHLNRFVKMLVALFAMLTLSVWLVFGALHLNVRASGIEITGPDGRSTFTGIKRVSLGGNGAIYEMENGQKLANMLVPANQLWFNTNIEVVPGSKVTITASGSATLSINRSIDISEHPEINDPRFYNNLVKPNGIALNGLMAKDRPADKLRRPLRIRPQSNLGALLATVQDHASFDPHTVTRPVPMSAATDGSMQIQFVADRRGELYLTVNDIVGSDSDDDEATWLLARDEKGMPVDSQQQAVNIIASYGGSVIASHKLAELKARWTAMVDLEYYTMFIEDNSGAYMVSISIELP